MQEKIINSRLERRLFQANTDETSKSSPSIGIDAKITYGNILKSFFYDAASELVNEFSNMNCQQNFD